MPDISKQLLQLRKDLGLTQAELAEKIGIHQTTISKFELGKIQLDQETIGKLMSCGLDLAKEKQSNYQVEEKEMIDTAKEITRIKEESGLSITDFANEVGVDFSYISRIVNGKKKPSKRFLERVIAVSKAKGIIQEVEDMKEIGHLKFIFNIENEIFDLGYSYVKKIQETTSIYTLIIDQQYFDFLRFLLKKNPNLERNMRVDNVQKVLLLISFNKVNFFYTLKIIGETTGIVPFKASKFEDTFNVKEESVTTQIKINPEQKKEENTSRRDILILCQNIIQIRDLLDQTLELAEKVVQSIVDKEKEVIEVKKERQIVEVVHKVYKQVVDEIKIIISIGTKTLTDAIIFKVAPEVKKHQRNWRVYYPAFFYRVETTFDDGTVEVGELVEFTPSNKIQEIESSDRKGVIGYVEHKVGIVEVIYYDRFANK